MIIICTEKNMYRFIAWWIFTDNPLCSHSDKKASTSTLGTPLSSFPVPPKLPSIFEDSEQFELLHIGDGNAKW